MKFSEEDKAVLAHVVLDPDAWLAHAVKTFGEEKATVFLKQKVDRWRPEYLAQKDLPDYKNRVERDAEIGLAQPVRHKL